MDEPSGEPSDQPTDEPNVSIAESSTESDNDQATQASIYFYYIWCNMPTSGQNSLIHAMFKLFSIEVETILP